jgi:hypothetical protein
LETSFLPGRSFASPATSSAQLGDGCAGQPAAPAGVGCTQPIRIEADRAMLPPVAPAAAGQLVAAARDHYVG